MEPNRPTPEQVSLDDVRRRRAELRESMGALEHTLAAPAPGRLDAWRQEVRVALDELSADFRAHIDVTEGPDGLYHRLLMTAPRLAKAVDRLIRPEFVVSRQPDDPAALLGEQGRAIEMVKQWIRTQA